MDEERRVSIRKSSQEKYLEHQKMLRSHYEQMMQNVKNGELSIDLVVSQLTEKQLELEKLAGRDKLTGLLNRTRGIEEFTEITRLEREHGHQPYLLMLDLDHFKHINDRFGHSTGDLVLEGVGQALREVFEEKSDGLIARLGGEEFGILIPDPDMENMAETIRKAGLDISRIVVEKTQNLEKGPNKVTVSLGGVMVLMGESVTDALKRADDCMYRAKRRDANGAMGRNRAMLLMGDKTQAPDAMEVKFTD